MTNREVFVEMFSDPRFWIITALFVLMIAIIWMT
jgi:hypothetical protein